MQDRQNMKDHDLLIRIDERMDGIHAHLERINGRLSDGDDKLEEHSGDIKMLKDRWKWAKWLVGGGAAGGTTGVGAFIKSIFGG